VDVEWKELFTVGAAGGQRAEYPLVPPGDYLFRVWGVTSTGEPTGHEATLAVTIPQVFWKTGPFLALGGIAFAIVIAGLARTVTRRRMLHQLTRVEQQRTLERERTRIARDIHDDLGTSLTRVSLLSQSLRSAVPPDSPAAENLEQVIHTSQEMTRAMEEIVWAVDPSHDSLDSVANYLGRFAQDFLSAAGMRCRLDLPVQLPSQPISAEVRHNLFLAFKEVLNNVVRHAGAREVNVALSVEAKRFVLSVADDGKGFSPAPASSSPPTRGGHGLANIRNRLAQIGGLAEVSSTPGRGTQVRLSVPLPVGGAAAR
jgi:signal transduction histidine kinase